MRTTKRTYKDSLFRDIFNNVKILPALYESLEGEPATVEDIRLTTIEEIFFDSEKNDVSFIAKNRHIILLEHQSTVNANMPLRILWYIAELYRQYVDPKTPYRTKLIYLPTPKFYVFYNGKTPMPQRWQKRLSDAFADDKGALELIVEAININEDAGDEILNKCAPLKAYSTFVAKVRQIVKVGKSLRQAVPEAIEYCIKNDYLKEYFQQKQAQEVFDMVNFVWDQELALKVRAEEAAEEAAEKAMEKGLHLGRREGLSQGLSQGLEKGLTTSICNVMNSMNFSMEKAMDVLQIPQEERSKYAALVKEC